MIKAAAIEQGGKVWSLPAPARHHHLIVLIVTETGQRVDGRQGFLDHEGNFLTREEALVEALKCRQVKEISGKKKLFSEDLW
jgi:hypothetical protein